MPRTQLEALLQAAGRQAQNDIVSALRAVSTELPRQLVTVIDRRRRDLVEIDRAADFILQQEETLF